MCLPVRLSHPDEVIALVLMSSFHFADSSVYFSFLHSRVLAISLAGFGSRKWKLACLFMRGREQDFIATWSCQVAPHIMAEASRCDKGGGRKVNEDDEGVIMGARMARG